MSKKPELDYGWLKGLGCLVLSVFTVALVMSVGESTWFHSLWSRYTEWRAQQANKDGATNWTQIWLFGIVMVGALIALALSTISDNLVLLVKESQETTNAVKAIAHRLKPSWYEEGE